MRYAFTLNGRTSYVQLEEHADGPKFVVEGEPFQPKVTEISKGKFAVELEGQTYSFQLEQDLIYEGANPLDLEIRRAKPVLARRAGAGRKAGGQVKPPMPGKVVELKVGVGDVVEEGQILLVLEAMKMQNDIKAAIRGTVKKVNVAAGANVEATTVMLEIEATPESA